jgi:hypothetical protein
VVHFGTLFWWKQTTRLVLCARGRRRRIKQDNFLLCAMAYVCNQPHAHKLFSQCVGGAAPPFVLVQCVSSRGEIKGCSQVLYAMHVVVLLSASRFSAQPRARSSLVVRCTFVIVSFGKSISRFYAFRGDITAQNSLQCRNIKGDFLYCRSGHHLNITAKLYLPF